MNIQPSYPTLNTADYSNLGSVVPSATIGHQAFPRERFSVVWRALSSIVPFGNTFACILSAIGQLQRKMAVSSAAVERRYNKWQQSDSKLRASPSVCSRCARR
jgi:hypothetical protein